MARSSLEQDGILDPGCTGRCLTMANDLVLGDPGEFLFYQTEDGRTRLHVRMEGETVWLSQRDMAELFQTSEQNVSLHIQNVFDERAVTPGATVKKYLVVQTEGSSRVERSVGRSVRTARTDIERR